MADTPATCTLSELLTACEDRIAARTGMRVCESDLESPSEYPTGIADAGFTVTPLAVRNTDMSRNRTVIRKRATLSIVMAFQVSPDQRAFRGRALAIGEKALQAVCDLSWLPLDVVDQIRYREERHGYHPRGRDWYLITAIIECDYDQTFDGV